MWSIWTASVLASLNTDYAAQICALGLPAVLILTPPDLQLTLHMV